MKREASSSTRPATRVADAVRARLRTLVCLSLLVLGTSASGCWQDGPIPEQEEEELEIIFGSTEADGGALATDYDFGVPVAVTLSADLGEFVVYTGTDPGFVSLEGGDGEDGLFPLADDLPVRIEITDIDEGVQIKIGEVVLSSIGDAALLGETPIHIHPEWQLIVPAAEEPQPRFVSFVLATTDDRFAPSEPYTATIAVAEEE